MATTVEAVRLLMAKHDWYYSFSDDGAVWRQGKKDEDALYALAAQLPQTDIDRLWSEHRLAKNFTRPVSKAV